MEHNDGELCVPLTKGKHMIINSSDFDLLQDRKWQATKGAGTFYARTNFIINGRRKTRGFHQLLMNTLPPLEVDHINGDGLDNRRKNLRVATRSENQMNRKCYNKSMRSIYKGVCHQGGNRKKPWIAVIVLEKKRIYLGHYATEMEAAKAFNVAALKYHGEFAYLNTID